MSSLLSNGMDLSLNLRQQ